jgi:hypothetical protein
MSYWYDVIVTADDLMGHEKEIINELNAWLTRDGHIRRLEQEHNQHGIYIGYFKHLSIDEFIEFAKKLDYPYREDQDFDQVQIFIKGEDWPGYKEMLGHVKEWGISHSLITTKPIPRIPRNKFGTRIMQCKVCGLRHLHLKPKYSMPQGDLDGYGLRNPPIVSKMFIHIGADTVIESLPKDVTIIPMIYMNLAVANAKGEDR